ncbi:MAG: hypothetical protein MUO24_02275 [Desulfobacterales bacterium]|nr:hypothetical protein [Desulfobacterales bacterium]
MIIMEEYGRWGVSAYNRKGMVHWWVDAPLNPEYVRSHCGVIEGKASLLLGLLPDRPRCKVCEKAMRRKGEKK